MPRRTNPLLLAAALAVGLLLAVGVAACGSSGSEAAATLETPPLTVGTGATLPSGSSTSTTTTSTSTTSTATDSAGLATGGAADTGGTVSGGATGDGTGTATGGDGTGDTTGGGGAPSTGGGTGTTTPAQPANPGGAAPNYQSFCNENPGAC